MGDLPKKQVKIEKPKVTEESAPKTSKSDQIVTEIESMKKEKATKEIDDFIEDEKEAKELKALEESHKKKKSKKSKKKKHKKKSHKESKETSEQNEINIEISEECRKTEAYTEDKAKPSAEETYQREILDKSKNLFVFKNIKDSDDQARYNMSYTHDIGEISPILKRTERNHSVPKPGGKSVEFENLSNQEGVEFKVFARNDRVTWRKTPRMKAMEKRRK